MFTQRQTYLERGLLAVMLLLTTAGQCAVLTNSLQTTTTPPPSDSPLTTQLSNSTMEEPRVLHLHTPCGDGYESFCGNGGTCIFPQDSKKPSCICTSSYSGQRCMFFTEPMRTLPELEQLIGISFGVIMLVVLLGVLLYCCVRKRCMKSAPLIKSAPSEISV
ncbi:epigen [Stegastes partitus]|uniref:Epigen-like n=1 Tax=Stegastes partitus TaxID=144197 RepID=A0A3B5BE00_9TELE|nr:PREDICTED: epigen-like [Stegastes partitus]